MNGPFASIMVIGGSDVFVELTEQVTELGQCIPDAQQRSSFGQVVRVSKAGRIRGDFAGHCVAVTA